MLAGLRPHRGLVELGEELRITHAPEEPESNRRAVALLHETRPRLTPWAPA
jgi:hypothetical protein